MAIHCTCIENLRQNRCAVIIHTKYSPYLSMYGDEKPKKKPVGRWGFKPATVFTDKQEITPYLYSAITFLCIKYGEVFLLHIVLFLQRISLKLGWVSKVHTLRTHQFRRRWYLLQFHMSQHQKLFLWLLQIITIHA